ncbi:hypothetical protein HDU99_001752 [Rhizoclosmatium hyalinum]|nr:hypothetical protein HDU99_001752 [Rhizoclosmatium hyalinum]
MSPALKPDAKSDKSDGTDLLLDETNYVVWKRLCLIKIGKYNARTLKKRFQPYVNPYKRPSAPKRWLNLLELLGTSNDSDSKSETSSDSDVDVQSEESEAGDGSNSDNGSDDHSEKCSVDQSHADTFEVTFEDYEKALKVWQTLQEREIEDANSVKATMKVILSNLTKSMQAMYSRFDNPAKLWSEIARTYDSVNRAHDTSAADAWKALAIKDGQSIPDFLKECNSVEDMCSAAGVLIHLSFEARKELRLRLDHRFSQSVTMLHAREFKSIADLESAMYGLWDAYVKAIARNAPSGVSANVTITGKRKRESTEQDDAPARKYRGRYEKCKNCPGSHNPKFDCDACWKCGSTGHVSKTCPTRRPKGEDKSDKVQANSALSATNVKEGPRHIGWTPVVGLHG